MLQHLLTSYRVIDKINLEENMVKIMGPYDPAKPLVYILQVGPCVTQEHLVPPLLV